MPRGVGSYLKLGGQLVMWGYNLPPLVHIGLTDLLKPGWAIVYSMPTNLLWHSNFYKITVSYALASYGIAVPDAGLSREGEGGGAVNPISTRGSDFAHHSPTSSPGFFLPFDGPAMAKNPICFQRL